MGEEKNASCTSGVRKRRRRRRKKKKDSDGVGDTTKDYNKRKESKGRSGRDQNPKVGMREGISALEMLRPLPRKGEWGRVERRLLVHSRRRP